MWSFPCWKQGFPGRNSLGVFTMLTVGTLLSDRPHTLAAGRPDRVKLTAAGRAHYGVV
jgi:hypothetical protein